MKLVAIGFLAIWLCGLAALVWLWESSPWYVHVAMALALGLTAPSIHDVIRIVFNRNPP